jgi:hypothetical protein
MQKVYTLAIDKAFAIQPLKGVGLMTLEEAEYWRGIALSMNRSCLVVNVKGLSA